MPIGATKDDDGVKRDKWGRYLLPKYGAKSSREVGHTRATTFAKSISDTFVLSQWGMRMAVKGLTMRPALYAQAAATPLDDRDALNRIAEEAKDAAGAKDAAALGTALHSFTEARDKGEDQIVPSPWDRDVAAYGALVDAAGLEFMPELIERIVVIDRFGVAGTFDRIARLKRDLTVQLPGRDPQVLLAGSWVVLDLKTGRDLTYGWNEIAIQLALYANADAMWDRERGEYEPLPWLNKEVALVIHLPVGKAKATLHAVDIAQGWAAAELCDAVRSWRKERTLASAVSVTVATELESEIAPAVHVADAVERVAQASSREELTALWREVTNGGQFRDRWTDELQILTQEQLSKIATA